LKCSQTERPAATVQKLHYKRERYLRLFGFHKTNQAWTAPSCYLMALVTNVMEVLFYSWPVPCRLYVACRIVSYLIRTFYFKSVYSLNLWYIFSYFGERNSFLMEAQRYEYLHFQFQLRNGNDLNIHRSGPERYIYIYIYVYIKHTHTQQITTERYILKYRQ
jgi:hypothetical protein